MAIISYKCLFFDYVSIHLSVFSYFVSLPVPPAHNGRMLPSWSVVFYQVRLILLGRDNARNPGKMSFQAKGNATADAVRAYVEGVKGSQRIWL